MCLALCWDWGNSGKQNKFPPALSLHSSTERQIETSATGEGDTILFGE